MHTLIIIRHAKSSWKDTDLSDFDRTLNKRGLRDAPFMGEKLATVLQTLKLKPSAIWTSSARRAELTAETIAQKIGFPTHDIARKREIYDYGFEFLNSQIPKQAEECKTLIVFGHNPDLTYLVNHYTKEGLSNLPTTGIFAIQFDCKWLDVIKTGGQKLFFEYPKLYFPKD